MGERSVAVHFPRSLPLSDGVSKAAYYTNPPDWYSASIPAMAAPADISGDQVYTTTCAAIHYPPIASGRDMNESFPARLSALPPAEKRMASSISYESCDSEHLLQQLIPLNCTLHVGTDGGLKHAAGSFSWVSCAPDHERLVSNSGPVDGWHRCQSSLRSEATAMASITLFLDEFAC
jgi:hypothetical protein